MNNSRRTYAVIVIILLGLVIGLIGCTEAPFKPTVMTREYPLALGNTWDYAASYVQALYDTAATDPALISVDTIIGTSSTVITTFNVLPDRFYTFVTDWEQGATTGTRTDYYNNLPDGFYLYGSSPDIWVGPPKLNPGEVAYEFKGFRAASLEELTRLVQSQSHIRTSRSLAVLDMEDPPIREIAFPLNIGVRWMYRDTTLGHVWNMEKEVVGREVVEVPAGSFECYKIQWFWDTDHNGRWDTDIDGYDYVSSVGTVRRQFMMFNIVVRDYEQRVIGYYNVISDYSLTDYALR